MIIGTAGHVDHGKSALVEALTGKRMDRLVEERRRGITIELNFAPLELPDGRQAGIVDVPGHEDFVQTMVAGASGLDLVLLIIAADEGLMPQTLEHRAILEQLGVPLALPVITKRDLVEPEWLELVLEEVTRWTAGSPVRFLAPVAVSARTGEGVEAVRQEIIAALATIPPRDRGDLFRMPVDRVFSVAGTGTVITGTAWSGEVRVGQALRLLPSGVETRIRSIESFGRNSEASQPGARTAIGLTGVDRGAVHRGELAVADGTPWVPVTAIDVRLGLLAGAGARLTERTRVRVHLGTAEVMARVYPRGQADGQILARLALEAPLVARGSDRFVLRSYSPVTTIGGGVVLDPNPPRRGATWPEGLASEQPSKRLEALAARRRWGLDPAELSVLLGVRPSEIADVIREAKGLVRLGELLIPVDLKQDLKSKALAALAGWHRENPLEAGMPASTLRQSLSRPATRLAQALITELIGAGALRQQEGMVSLPGFRPLSTGTPAEVAALVTQIEAAGLTAPTVGELERETGRRDLLALVRRAAGEGRLEAVSSDWFLSRAALDGFVAELRTLGGKGAITPAALRERLGLTRKYLIPLLEWADAKGHTRREGDHRVLVARR
jgi:selenocysteine-specific elongation factor